MNLLPAPPWPGRRAFLPALLLALALPGCGGGGDEEPLDPVEPPVVGPQQHPEGFWEGTVGSGLNEQPMAGFIDGGDDGKGGEFYLVRSSAQAAGYDVLYGVLRVTGSVVAASGVTYFSRPDSKSTTGLTLRASASADPVTSQTNSIVGSYSDPVVNGNTVPFRLHYSPLNAYPTSERLAAGSYSGEAGTFDKRWAFTVAVDGSLEGTISDCAVTGFMVPRQRASALYAVSIDFPRKDKATTPEQDAANPCTFMNVQHRGVAILRFDTYGAPQGIWVFMRSATKDNPVLVLNGRVEATAPKPEKPGTTPVGPILPVTATAQPPG